MPTLGSSGLDVSTLCLGTNVFGWTADESSSHAVLDAYVGGGGNSTALVGSPETVAAAILDYVEIGVNTVLIRGYDPLQDAVDYGRDLLPLVRQELAHRAGTARAS